MIMKIIALYRFIKHNFRSRNSCAMCMPVNSPQREKNNNLTLIITTKSGKIYFSYQEIKKKTKTSNENGMFPSEIPPSLVHETM